MRSALAIVVLAGGSAFLPAASAAPDPVALSVRIERPLGGQTSDRVVTVTGSVEGYRGDRATLVVNGIPLSVALSGGRFTQPQVLAPGPNAIRAVVEQDGRFAEDVVALHASVPSKDLRVTLTWETRGTDVDLWVTGPDGEKVKYDNRNGKAGGVLDTDVTDGYGPETYTHARLARGTYRIEAHAYRIERPTRVEVTTVRREGTSDEERRTFRGVLSKTGDVSLVGLFVEP